MIFLLLHHQVKQSLTFTHKTVTVGAHNDLAMKNNHGCKLLPPSMKPPVYVPSTTQYAGQSRHSRPGVIEEIVGDERLIYQVTLRDLYQPTIEAILPYGLLSFPLYRHQKTALIWKLDKENSVACSGGILADDQEIKFEPNVMCEHIDKMLTFWGSQVVRFRSSEKPKDVVFSLEL
ncbi:unnamed protein product [Lactuca virosa]|uniref:Uncharacterized protein n=1 Tax=Lactuca virosa TaxID=75947 RepID=A0AAU9N5H1_9ASTR|nr:unnamed protein product [Lactuca virosa]